MSDEWWSIEFASKVRRRPVEATLCCIQSSGVLVDGEMQMRAMAFLTRSVRQDSRLLSHHLVRAAMPALILYLFAMQFQLYSVKGSAGGQFASTVLVCCYWFLTLLGSVHFSTAIVEEKEEQTLSLLKMTGASPFAILVGKSVPRLVVAVLLLSVVTPFLMLAITLGGVLPTGLISATLSILCYAVMLSQLGLFASVVARTARQAISLTSVLWAVFELADWWHWLAVTAGRNWFGNSSFGNTWNHVWNDLLGWMTECTLLGNLRMTLFTFGSLRSEASNSVWRQTLDAISDVWHFHMTFQLVVAAAFFLLSWVLFEPLTSRATGDGAAVGEKRTQSGISRRSWQHALAWKSWQYLSGGKKWMLLRSLGVPVLVIASAMALLAIFDGSMEPWAIASITLTIGIVVFVISLARLFGRVLTEEVQQKTLATLMMIPQSTSRTLNQLLGGLLPAILASAVCGLLGVVWVFLLGLSDTSNPADFVTDVFEFVLQPWFWHCFSWVVLTLVVGLWLTTYIRYGGMLLAVVLLWIVTPMLCTMTMAVVAMGVGIGGGPGDEVIIQYVIPLILIIAELAIGFGVRTLIVRRMDELAAR